MFEDFDSMDMYGFLDYLEESSNNILEVNKDELDTIVAIEKSYGIYEENGQLFIENEVLDSVTEKYNLSEEEAIDIIVEACEREINAASYNEGLGDYNPMNIKDNFNTLKKDAEEYKKIKHAGLNPSQETKDKYKDHSIAMAKSAAVPAGAALATGGALAARAIKKRQEEKRRNKGLKGMIRRGIKRFREDFGIYEENGQLFIENEVLDYVMDEFDLYEEDALEILMDVYNEEMVNEGIADYNPMKMKQKGKDFYGAGRDYVGSLRGKEGSLDKETARKNLATSGKAFAKSAALPAAGAVGAGVGATVLARRAMKKHQARKLAKQQKKLLRRK